MPELSSDCQITVVRSLYIITVPALLADESTRVCLQPIRGVDGSDYINASFIDVSNCLHVSSQGKEGRINTPLVL